MRSSVWIGVLLAGACFAATSEAPLAEAAAAEDWARVRTLLAEKADVNTPQVDGATALHWAAHYDQTEIVDALLAAGANVKAANRYGITALAEACLNGNAEMIASLLKAGADPNLPQMEGETPLMTAARTGNSEAVRVLLDNGADVNTAEEWRGQTALMWAAAEGHPETIKLLLDRGAAIDAKSNVFDWTALRPKPGSVAMNFPRGGFTPLLFAARQGNLEAVKTLVAAGADVNLADPDGVSPLLISIINFHFDVAGHLIESGADVNASENKGRSPLYAAVEMRTLDVSNRPTPKIEDKLSALDIVKMLLAKGASPHASLIKVIPARAVLDGADAAMGPGATPFLRAARGSDVEAMKLLVAAGANPRSTTQDGATAMHLAAGLGWRDGKTRASDPQSVEAIQYLASLGLGVADMTNRTGETPLHGAAGRGADLVVQALVDMGADVNALDKTKRTPLDVAIGVGGNPNAVRVVHESTAKILEGLGGHHGPSEEPQTTASAK